MVVDVYFVHHSRNIVVAMDNEITLDLSGAQDVTINLVSRKAANELVP